MTGTTKNGLASISFALLLLLIPHTFVQAEIYQWKDADGRTYFGDKPPVENAQEIQFKEQKLSNLEKQELHERRVKQLKLIQLMQEERFNREKEKQQQLAYEAKLKAECKKAKNYKQDALDSTYLYEEDENGQQHILSDDEYKAHMEEIDKYIQEYC